MIKVIVKEPGKPCEVKEIENTLLEHQKIVDGYIETIPFASDAVLIVNEEGKLMGLEPNFRFGNDLIVGTAIIIGVDEDEFTGLSDKQIELIKANSSSIWFEGAI